MMLIKGIEDGKRNKGGGEGGREDGFGFFIMFFSFKKINLRIILFLDILLKLI